MVPRIVPDGEETMVVSRLSIGKNGTRGYERAKVECECSRVAVRLAVVATGFVCFLVLNGCVTAPLGDVAIEGETEQISLDELALAILCGETREAEAGVLELSARADASRKWFEVFLLGFRRRENIQVVGMCLDGADKWGKRHRKDVKYLEEDANSFAVDRNFLARICLRTTETRDEELHTALCVGSLLYPVEGKLFFAMAGAGAGSSLDEVFLRGIEGELLLGRTCKATGLEQGLPAAQAEDMIEKATGLPIVWHPKMLRATKRIDVGSDSGMPEGKVGAYQLLEGLVRAAAYERPDVNATASMVILTRRAIFIIGLPAAGAVTDTKRGSTITDSDTDKKNPTTRRGKGR